ncbi:hypothetical protein D0859_09227 [Hortaea werneckii]|uniref:F-box domain-containing protein n=1 Tax=Hortaea werneckii TaxID=91943 RepID=A0A3M7IMI5_HORWE|nr:hypothetical protein D0859_09227 [Hortaea werneckii]
MLELPSDLHLRIAECLSQADLFNFRLSCKTLSSPGHSVLFSSQKVSWLYIHPTTIKRFIDICHDSVLASKVTTVVVLGHFMLDGAEPRQSQGLCHLPWPCSEGNDHIPAFPSEKVPFPAAYKHVIAATKNLSNLQKIAYTNRATMVGLNSTSDFHIVIQARHCPFKAAEDDARPFRWSDMEFIMGLALHVPNIIHIWAHYSSYHLLGDTKSFDLLFPANARRGKKNDGEDGIKKQIFEQLDLKLRSLTYEPVNRFMPIGRSLLGHALLQHCSSIRNVEIFIGAHLIDSDPSTFCIRACRGLKNLCSFKLGLLYVNSTLFTADHRMDDSAASQLTAALKCALSFKEFVLQHVNTLETCVVDIKVSCFVDIKLSNSEDQLGIFAEELRGFSPIRNNDVRMCTRMCKPLAARDGDRGALRALRIVVETE